MKKILSTTLTLSVIAMVFLSLFSLTAVADTTRTTIFDADVSATVEIPHGGGSCYLNVEAADAALRNDYALDGSPNYYSIYITATSTFCWAGDVAYPFIVSKSGEAILWDAKLEHGSSFATNPSTIFGCFSLDGKSPSKICIHSDISDRDVTLTVTHSKQCDLY